MTSVVAKAFARSDAGVTGRGESLAAMPCETRAVRRLASHRRLVAAGRPRIRRLNACPPSHVTEWIHGRARRQIEQGPSDRGEDLELGRRDPLSLCYN